MSITYDVSTRCFSITTANSSYLFELAGGRYPIHLYYGPRIHRYSDPIISRLTMDRYDDQNFNLNECSLDHLPQECPVFGGSDLRPGMLEIRMPDGTCALDLSYHGHEIVSGKPSCPDLPGARGNDAETLIVSLLDERSHIEVRLLYTVWADLDIIGRRVEIVNRNTEAVSVERAFSLCLDFENSDMDLITLNGAWAREREVYRRKLLPGYQGASTERGASSHQTSPFLAVLDSSATESQGDVYGFALCYSGSFSAGVNVDQFGIARAMLGINDANFSWQLGHDESFVSPEAYMVYSGEGLGGMSRRYHRFVNGYITSGKFANSPRPILINNWEATYFDFNEEKLLNLAKCAKEVGIDLFVLDDGWFGKRDDDHSSLGDWTDDLNKLPHGLRGLSDQIHDLGLKFGLWVEPEMISPVSRLYEQHPDWCIHIPGFQQIESRYQLVLDLSRTEVQDYLIEAICSALERGNVDYVKWDMNRNITPWGSTNLDSIHQKELGHRYILGLYRIMREITGRFPNVLFESCAGGGGRFDLGILCYMPQTWCSDDTDAWMRCVIQHGTSFVFPPCTMGAHVSAVPNHQTGRITPLETRAHVAMGGTFGYELDLQKLPQEELEQIKAFNEHVHALQSLFYYGTYYRLQDPGNGNEAAWMSVSSDQREAIVTHVFALSMPHVKSRLLKLAGLAPDLDYIDEATGIIWGGDELMSHGIPITAAKFDFMSQQIHLKAIEK